MLGAIPNPKKSLQIERPISEVRDAVKDILLFSNKYTWFKLNDVFNEYTLDAVELLSLGVYIDITCASITDNRTEVKIELRRKLGSFNQGHEVTLANQHIVTITDLLSKSISTDASERLTLREQANIAQQEATELSVYEKQNSPGKYYGKQLLQYKWEFILAIIIVWVAYGYFTAG